MKPRESFSTPNMPVLTFLRKVHAVVLGMWVALCARPAEAVSTFVPLDHPAYGQVEGWVARGVLPPTALGIRPYTWEHVARLLDASRPRAPADQRQLDALRRQAERYLSGRPYWGNLRVTGAVVNGKPIAYPSVPSDSGGPLQAYQGGRAYRETFGGDAELTLGARAGARLALTATPRITFGQAGGGNPGWQEGYAALDAGPLRISFGRQPIVWGPARHGGFLLTANAAPLPSLRLGRTEPGTYSPDNRRHFDFDLFLARLEENRDVPRPYLAGLRLTWQPHPRLELAVSRTIMAGGVGQPSLSPADLLTILTGRNLSGAADTSNSIAGLDLAWTQPLSGGPGRALRLYAEYAGEDEASAWPTKPAVRAGFLLAGMGREGHQTFRAEFAATDVFYDQPKWPTPVWYRHGVYTSGYTYRGRVLGDAMGPDARDARLWWTRSGSGNRFECSVGWLATRFSASSRETRRQVGLIWERRALGPTSLALSGQLERLESATTGLNTYPFFVSLALELDVSP